MLKNKFNLVLTLRLFEHSSFKLIVLAFLSLLLIVPTSRAETAMGQFSKLKNAGLLMVDVEGQPLVSKRSQKAFIPASTTKLVTAWLALTHWGEDYHFRTHFYWDDTTKTLWVKGSGDPFLVSEELDLIAWHLLLLGIQNVNAIGLDVTFFETDLITPGAGNDKNPYAAMATAVAGNFNTVAIKKVAGKLYTTEPQTPLTAFAKNMAKHFKGKVLRTNTGRRSRDAERYFAQLLAAQLRRQGVVVGEKILWGSINQEQPIYTHVNTKSLAEMIRLMLKYSTNFVANQLVLVLSAEQFQRPANFFDVQRYVQNAMAEQFNWKNFVIKDGAGLSRANRLSPRQLVQLLTAFEPWRDLLPEIQTGVFAKTGSLQKVRTLAGYLQDSQQRWKTFALMMNQAVPYRLRNRIANELIER